MAKISARIEELDDVIKGLEQVKLETVAISGEVDGVHKELDASWDGAACEEYLKRLGAQEKELKVTVEVIDGFIKYAKKVRDDLKAEDEKHKKIIEALKEFMERFKKIFFSLLP